MGPSICRFNPKFISVKALRTEWGKYSPKVRADMQGRAVRFAREDFRASSPDHLRIFKMQKRP